MGVVQHIKNAGLAALVCLNLVWISDRDAPQDYRLAQSISGGFWPSGRPVPPARPSGDLVIHYEFDRDRECPLVVQRTVTDSEHQLIILPEEPYTPEGLGHISMNRPMPVPANANPGEAKAKIVLKFYCNPIHWFWPIQVNLTVPFQIEPRS